MRACLLLVAAAMMWPAAAREMPLGELPGLSTVPFEQLDGKLGSWVRYRMGGQDLPRTSYMTIALVGRDDTGRQWYEIRVSHSHAPGSSGFAARLLMDRGETGGLVAERYILSFNGSHPIEVDMSSLPAEEPAEEEAPPPMTCTSPDDPRCAEAGLDWRTGEEMTVMTGMGSLRVRPMEVMGGGGRLFTYYLCDQVPLTGVAGYDAPTMGFRLEVDAAGEDAKRTVGDPVRIVKHDELGEALLNTTPQLRSISKLGVAVNPDERAAEEAALAAEAAMPENADDESQEKEATP